jgi:hypothetical protein
VAPPGNQAENRENKSQPTASGGTGLLDILMVWAIAYQDVCNSIVSFYVQSIPLINFLQPLTSGRNWDILTKP